MLNDDMTASVQELLNQINSITIQDPLSNFDHIQESFKNKINS